MPDPDVARPVRPRLAGGNEHGESSAASGTVEIGAEDDAIPHGDGDTGVDTDGRLGGKRGHRTEGDQAGRDD
jgi:hypothetical protein